MWEVKNNNLQMAEGDFGVKLPFRIKGFELAAGDSVKFVIKSVLNGTEILSKTYDSFSENSFDLELTESESERLPVGNYVYRLDAYQAGNYLCNLIPSASFKVVDKA